MERKETRHAAWRRSALVLCLSLCTMLAAGAALSQEEVPVEEDVDAVADPSIPSALAQFTTSVENREPVDQVSFVENDVRTIIFFSDLRQLEGRTVTHRWLHGDIVRAEVSFEVRGPRWRVWSSKELLEDWLGDWTVEIVADDGEVIAAETFTYTDAGR